MNGKSAIKQVAKIESRKERNNVCSFLFMMKSAILKI